MQASNKLTFALKVFLMATFVIRKTVSFRIMETRICTCLQWPQSMEEYFCLSDYAYVGRVTESTLLNHESLGNKEDLADGSTSDYVFTNIIYTIVIEEILSGIPDKLKGARIKVTSPQPGQLCGVELMLNDVYLVQGFGNFREADLCDMFEKYDTIPDTFKEFLASEETESLCENYLSFFSSYF